ncbi:MAG: penicillin-binding protein 2 [Acidimicrobiia bacterium]|jgi:penicillin-binding protein 2
MTEANSRFRLTVVGFVVFALFSALFARLWFLQVGSSTSYAAQTEQNRIRTIREPAIRGSIIDATGKVMVQNTLVDTITVKRGLTDEERAITVKNLARVLAVTSESIDAELDSPKYSVYEPVPIAQKATFETLVYVREHPELFPGVSAERQSIREYPERLPFDDSPPVGAHLLGYVGSINKSEYKIQKRAGYTPNDLIGKQGIEQLFESELKGKPRERKLEVDSRGRLVGEAEVIAPEPGHDVQLTVNSDVQRVAEESLRDGMIGARNFRDRASGKTFRATGGSVVVLNAQNGDIVAMASAPTYNIGEFTTGIPADKYQEYVNPESNQPLINRAVNGLYAPGSTFKTFSLYSALRDTPSTEDGTVFDENFRFFDRGFIKFGATGQEVEFQNAGRTPNGSVDAVRAMTVSSDVFFYNIGLLYWRTWGRGDEGNLDPAAPVYGMQRTAKLFGFSKQTGIGFPDEARGRVPDLVFKQAVNKDNPDESSRLWLPGDGMNLAVGQGDVLVTPLQLAVAYGAFANGGTIFQPRLAKAVYKGGSTLGDPELVRDLPTQPSRKISIDQSIIDKIIPGLEGAVCSEEGTAYGAFKDYPCGAIMGKTGTAEVPNKQDTALFVGVTPSRVDPAHPGPQYVVVVVVEEGGFGGSVAAPIARRVIDALKGDPNPPAVRVFPPSTD